MINDDKCTVEIPEVPWNSTCLLLRLHIPEMQTHRASIQCPHRAAHMTSPFRASPPKTIRKTVLMIPIITAMQLQQQGINYDQILQRFQWPLVPLCYRLRSLHVVTLHDIWISTSDNSQKNQCVQQLFVNQPRKRGLRYSSDGNAWRLSPILKVWLLPYLALLCIVSRSPKVKQQI